MPLIMNHGLAALAAEGIVVLEGEVAKRGGPSQNLVSFGELGGLGGLQKLGDQKRNQERQHQHLHAGRGRHRPEEGTQVPGEEEVEEEDQGERDVGPEHHMPIYLVPGG